MSKHKRSSSHRRHKSNKCPEPFNTLIDLAGGLAMAAIAGRMEKKHHYAERGKINPYGVSAFGIATGRMKSTEDILRTGAVLGALGSFDDETAARDDELFSVSAFVHENDNRYAWRLNCEDGSAYGISPEDYETRGEYNEALHREKYAWREFCEDGSEYGLDPKDYETAEEFETALERARACVYNDSDDSDSPMADCSTPSPANPANDSESAAPSQPGTPEAADANIDPFADDDFHVYVYCKVRVNPSGAEIYYRTEDHSLRKGDKVLVPDPVSGEGKTGEIVTVEYHMRFSVPTPVEETPMILAKI
ncbi:MAG: hypothetical protein LJU34_09060 [Oscillospiraceae bacterium]|nr:hypothetical protein [Oscillospiraceae bacterium]